MLRLVFLLAISSTYPLLSSAQTSTVDQADCNSVVVGSSNSVQTTINCNFITGKTPWSVKTLADALSTCDHNTVRYFLDNDASANFFLAAAAEKSRNGFALKDFLICGRDSEEIQTVALDIAKVDGVAAGRIADTLEYETIGFFWAAVLAENFDLIDYLYERGFHESASTFRDVGVNEPPLIFAFPEQHIFHQRTSFIDRKKLWERIEKIVSERVPVCKSKNFNSLGIKVPRSLVVQEILSGFISEYYIQLDTVVGVFGEPARWLWISGSAIPHFVDGTTTGPDPAAFIVDTEFPNTAFVYRSNGEGYSTIKLRNV